MITIRKARATGEHTETAEQPAGKTVTIPAPVQGWIENRLEGAGMQVAENVFPTQKGVRMRGGRFKVANVGAPIVSMFSFTTATMTKLFAATETAIFDVSNLDPEATLTADVTGMTAGYYSAAQIGTVADEYLYAVNGTDEARLYDGAAWAAINDLSTPAITGAVTSGFSYVWTHKNRFWFVQKGTKIAWFLPVDSIGGAATDFSLAGVFQEGGSLLFGCTWSQDSGAGMDDRQVFVSDQGEVAVYEGTNPTSATDWALVGVYKMDPPLGPKAHFKAGGDVMFATTGGLVALSGVVQKDPAALGIQSVSAAIESSWRLAVRNYVSILPWEAIKWPRESMMLVSLPSTGDTALVANMTTGAWAKFIGWDVRCTALHDDRLFFGSEDGGVYEAERGGSDDGASYVCRWSALPSDMGTPGAFKTVGLARATFISAVPFTAKLSFTVDYEVDFPAAPNAAADPASADAIWDIGTWDASTWDSGSSGYTVRPIMQTGWESHGASGFVIAPQVQITSNGTRRPDAEFLSMDILLNVGAAVA